MPSGSRNSIKQGQPATLVVNHVYHSLPQTPLMGFAPPTDLLHNQRHYSMTQPKPQHRQKECLLGEHRRRSYGDGEKDNCQLLQQQLDTSQSSRQEPHNSECERDGGGGGGDCLPENRNSAAFSSRFKFLPLLVNSHSSENFHQLRRVAMATV